MNPRYEAPLPTTGKRETLKRMVFNVVKRLYRIDLLTYDVFYTMRKQVVDEALIEDCREINCRIWRYNPPTRAAIEERKRTLLLPKDYVGIHIRRGDKYREIGHTDIRQYMDKLAAQSSCREVFVATDDYAVYEELCSRYPDWHFHTLTPEQHKGYDQRTFEKYPKERKRDEMIALFTDIEVLAASSLFVGTLSSNIGMYLYWRLPKGKCIGVDYGDWQIW